MHYAGTMIHSFSLIEKALLAFDVLPHPLLDGMATLMAGRALHLSVKLGIIDVLEDGPAAAAAIAGRTGLSERGLVVLLDCLEPLGYVRRDGESYALTERGQKFLSRASPRNFRAMMLLCDYTFESLNTLEQTLRAGGPSQSNLERFSPAQWEFFNQAMVELARTNKEEIASLIDVPASATRLVDLGGGHGLYTIELCQRHPRLSGEIFDFAPVRDLLDKHVAEAGMGERVRLRDGDFMKEPLGTGYDVALAFNIIHGFRPHENRDFFTRVRQALNPGGVFVVLDQIRGMSGKTPLAKLTAASLGLNLFHQAGGQSYPLEEVEQWSQAAGFRSIQLKRTRTPGFALILCRK
jgi:SAM-dependent methyltransferase